MPNADITIVLATYNRAEMLKKALEALISQKTDGKFVFEILLIDDGSTDDTKDVVREMSNNLAGITVRYIYQKNSGHSVALNKGVEKAQGNWLAFFDDDQWAEPRWLAELYKAAQEMGAACVGGTVWLDLPESPPLELGPRFSRQIFNERPRAPKTKNYSPKNILSSGNVLIHRSVFDQIGGFDTSLPRGYDTDFFWRVDKEGFNIGYAPQAMIHHVIPAARLTFSYLKEISLLNGTVTARVIFKHGGPAKLVIANLWRIGVVLGRDLLLMTIAGICHDRCVLLDSRCAILYAIGFFRSSILLFASGVIGSKTIH